MPDFHCGWGAGGMWGEEGESEEEPGDEAASAALQAFVERMMIVWGNVVSMVVSALPYPPAIRKIVHESLYETYLMPRC